MNTNIIDFIRNIVHAGSVAVLLILIALAIVGFVKPKLFRFVLHEFAERKYILASGIFIALICGTVFVATQAPQNTLESQKHTPSPESSTFIPDQQSNNYTDASQAADSVGSSSTGFHSQNNKLTQQAPAPAQAPTPQPQSQALPQASTNNRVDNQQPQTGNTAKPASPSVSANPPKNDCNKLSLKDIQLPICLP